MLKIRKMTQKDKPRMLEIVKNIWDGNDYLPLVFDTWIKDKKGEFVAAVDEKGEIIGFEKLTMLSDNDVWIEGLRKDEKSNIKGVGHFLTEYFLSELSKDPKIKTIRFATYFRLVKSIGLFSKMGFRIIEKRNHKYYRLPKLKNIPAYEGNRAEVTYDKTAVLNFIHKSDWLKKNKKGICYSWVVKPFNDEMIIKDYIDKGRCISIKENNKIVALCQYTIREKEDFFISFFEADSPELFKELLQKIKQTAYQNGQNSLCIVLSMKDERSSKLFKTHKFRSWEGEGDFLIFDYPVRLLWK
ncbi:MAG: GNAT family N-acetyltransferase [Candidatus Delongbacteria bacterium]|nr:GNAT family N-acetyltransferase [Candidatus Delongbacteria bacterium]MCG2760952.1 GNAT family N-acetyltransferase [Candidatus Delongbacteria bacterium]